MTTSARIIDGKQRAAGLRRNIAIGVRHLSDREGVTPKLVTVLVGSDPASAIYVRRKASRRQPSAWRPRATSSTSRFHRPG
jgi:methylenetetrahydrofolate dehydrogenase (NADP+)/methenyltetrahydrofolate cyclohydrolase